VTYLTLADRVRVWWTRFRCRRGWHYDVFAYAPVPGGYRPEVSCMRCLRVVAPKDRTPRLGCAWDIHQGQNLTAPPSWRKGDALKRGRYCIWCDKLIGYGQTFVVPPLRSKPHVRGPLPFEGCERG
jgi:hypothetical protein